MIQGYFQPSVTDLVRRIVDETRGDLHEAKNSIKRDKLIFSIKKSKIDSSVRVLMNLVLTICILKMKEGYPSIKKMTSNIGHNYYYVPKNNDKYSTYNLNYTNFYN